MRLINRALFAISQSVQLCLRSADSAQARHRLDPTVAMSYYLMIMARTKRTPSPEPLKVCSLALTPSAERLLNDLSQDATDAIGRPVSNSALVRALLQYLAQQPSTWTATTLYPLIEQEIGHGRVWGKKKSV